MPRILLPGAREPNGRLSRAKAFIPLSLLRSLVSAGKVSGLYTTAFGLLAVDGRLTNGQFEAGLKFAKQRLAADRAKGITRVKAQDINKGAFGFNDLGDSPDVYEKGAIAIRRWENAVIATGGYSNAPYKALEWIVLSLRTPEGYEQVCDLKRGLTSLVNHYGSRE